MESIPQLIKVVSIGFLFGWSLGTVLLILYMNLTRGGGKDGD